MSKNKLEKKKQKDETNIEETNQIYLKNNNIHILFYFDLVETNYQYEHLKTRKNII